eukprot:9001241-Pyramimonas_sp.AAC.1
MGHLQKGPGLYPDSEEVGYYGYPGQQHLPHNGVSTNRFRLSDHASVQSALYKPGVEIHRSFTRVVARERSLVGLECLTWGDKDMARRRIVGFRGDATVSCYPGDLSNRFLSAFTNGENVNFTTAKLGLPP